MLPATEIASGHAPSITSTSAFTRYSWAVLGWNLVVVLWGAYVRASGSGAGCGNRWPLCNGEVAPSFPRLQTVIEFAHRASSGVALILVVALLVWSLYRFPRGHRVRRAAGWSMAFLIFEAMLGAGLVLFDYVDQNASVGRVIYLCLHLVNTQLLVAALALTAWFSRPGASRPAARMPIVAATLPVTVAVSITGVIAALGDTLFPATSLVEGMRQDIATTANFLVRLRVLHPVFAIAGAAFIIYAAVAALRRVPRPSAARIAVLVIITAFAQLIAGAMNLAMLAPAWMQMLHLLIADTLWILLVLLVVEAADGRPFRGHAA